MTTSRVITATAILALVAGATAADAATRRKPAPKPVCKIMQDPASDATEALATTAPNDPALDIVSADIATDATRVTAVWRVSKLSGDTTSWPGGRGYQTSFKVRGVTLILQAVTATSGNSWQNGAGTGMVDSAKNEIRLTVPLATFKSVQVKPGDKITEMVATSWRTALHTEVKLGRVDSANAVAPYYYTAGAKSCVAVGA